MLNGERNIPFYSVGVRVLCGSDDPNEIAAARIVSVFLRSDARPNPSL